MRPLVRWRGCCGRSPSTARTACAGRSRPASSRGGHFDELAFRRSLATMHEQRQVVVPEALRGYEVEHASARDYDRLLPGGAL